MNLSSPHAAMTLMGGGGGRRLAITFLSDSIDKTYYMIQYRAMHTKYV